jgi:hypothetical protein
MMQDKNLFIQDLYFDKRMVALLETLDQMHTAASEGRLQNVTTFTHSEIIEWLLDVIYTAQETLDELQDGRLSMTKPRLADSDNPEGIVRQKGHSA